MKQRKNEVAVCDVPERRFQKGGTIIEKREGAASGGTHVARRVQQSQQPARESKKGENFFPGDLL